MVLIPLLLVCVGLAVVFVIADISIKRILNISGYLRISEFATSFIIAGLPVLLFIDEEISRVD